MKNEDGYPVALVEFLGGQTAWCLYLEPYDISTLLDMHSGVTKNAFLKEINNPHLQKLINDGIYPSCIKLGTDWLRTVSKQDRPILINKRGGWCYESNYSKILKRAISKEFPVPESFIGEIFTLSKWLDGSHWYISSNQKEITTDKFNTWEEAYNWCKEQNSLAEIKEKIIN